MIRIYRGFCSITFDDAIKKADSKTFGKCEVCHEYVEPEVLEVDYTARDCIEHLSELERRHLEGELGLAQNVQTMLLPQEAPIFSCLPVKSDILLFYDVEIRDCNRKHVYRIEYVNDMVLVFQPPDILRPDQAYQ